MAHYKWDGELGEVLKAEDVYTPTITILAADKDTNTYPIEGWYWFETDEEADALINPDVVSRFQGIAALSQMGLLVDVENYMTNTATDIEKIAWNNVGEFRRNSPMIAAVAAALAWTPQTIDNLFTTAKSITA